MRVGYVRHFHAHDIPADPEVATALDATARLLEREGARLSEATLPPLQEFAGVNRVVMYSEAWSIHAEWLRTRPQDYGRSGRQRLMAGAFLSAEDYLRAQRHRTVLVARVEDALREVDLLLVANMLDPACRIDDPKALAFTAERQARLGFNVTGHPAMSIVTGFSRGGLPLSAQLVGPMRSEATLFQASAALERAGLFVELPDLHGFQAPRRPVGTAPCAAPSVDFAAGRAGSATHHALASIAG